ncbi:MAG: hypothetical protein ACJAWL_003304 [Motiliproteus sp.]|jgi:hypothetical protein
MTDVACLRKQPLLTEVFLIEKRGESCWWVFCQPLAWDGLPLPTSRPVFFARFESRARAWVEARQKL